MTPENVRNRNVPLVVGFGGGVDSVAALIWLRNQGIVPDLISFADTGAWWSHGEPGEKPETYAHIDNVVRPWLAANGFPELTVVHKESPRVGDLSLEQECLRRETLPSRAFGMSSCAMRWKIEPQEKFLNHYPPAKAAWAAGKKPIKLLGYDADEDHRVKVFEDGKLRYWYPLFDAGIGRTECEALILAEGLPLPPKSACFFCPSSTKAEVLRLAGEHPDLMRRALEIERRAIESVRHDLRNIKGLGRHWSWAHLLAANEAQRERMLEAPVEACTLCAL